MFRACFANTPKDPSSSLKNEKRSPASAKFDVVREKVLLEVVGAMGLSSIKDFTNSYCTVDVNDKTVHKTSIVKVRNSCFVIVSYFAWSKRLTLCRTTRVPFGPLHRNLCVCWSWRKRTASLSNYGILSGLVLAVPKRWVN